jgi:hypothetical protein
VAAVAVAALSLSDDEPRPSPTTSPSASPGLHPSHLSPLDLFFFISSQNRIELLCIA